MMYTMLRDSDNMYPLMQKRLLKRFIEKQVLKLRQLSEQDSKQELNPEHGNFLIEARIETYNELLAAHKELIELTAEQSDQFAFLG